MVEEISSWENFAVTLEKSKLSKTATVLREEFEKKIIYKNIKNP